MSSMVNSDAIDVADDHAAGRPLQRNTAIASSVPTACRRIHDRPSPCASRRDQRSALDPVRKVDTPISPRMFTHARSYLAG
jgi:hypothetical protein